MKPGNVETESTRLLTELFKFYKLPLPADNPGLFGQFIRDDDNQHAIKAILQNQRQLMAKWSNDNRIAQIKQQPIRILNGTVDKPYESSFDFEKLKLTDITEFQFEGLTEAGLHFDESTNQITGVPGLSGDHKIVFKFKLQGEPAEHPFHEKTMTLIVNPDPRKLWKTLESDKTDPYWKENDVTVFTALGDRLLLASSRRGRSHANVGSFREDDFSCAELGNGWNLIAVADGAGSARLSRKGSAIACKEVVQYFKENGAMELMAGFDELIPLYKNKNSDETQLKINRLVYNNLGKAVFQVHKKLEEFAISEKVPLKDLNSTLVFSVLKKYTEGYAVLSFGVGDCPIALLNPDKSAVTLMNWIDVGEFDGGTRFITMPEIFRSDKFASRFGFRLVDDFSYLVLMSDGIYDAKFVVESALADIKKWHEFLADLGGKNEDGIKVDLNRDNPEIKDQFSKWMDFWSPGNHDDRTLALLF